jgi:hypothetical protein
MPRPDTPSLTACVKDVERYTQVAAMKVPIGDPELDPRPDRSDRCGCSSSDLGCAMLTIFQFR